jgi:hypothetical protein
MCAAEGGTGMVSGLLVADILVVACRQGGEKVAADSVGVVLPPGAASGSALFNAAITADLSVSVVQHHIQSSTFHCVWLAIHVHLGV